MYVRWETARYHHKRHRWSMRDSDDTQVTVTLRAVVMRSERVNGQPRQRRVGYLGSIQEPRLASPIHRGYFWRKVKARLDALVAQGAITSADRDALAWRVAARVPVPTAEERDVEQRDHERARQKAFARPADV